LKKIVIANRGEIAVRVIRTCREMGVRTVAVYSACDRAALHVQLADEAYAIGPDQASESYLRIDKLVDVARASKADAVHPGYGFLAENAEFASACADAGVTFIGPTPKAMRELGSKTGARQIAMAAGVPVVPGTRDPLRVSASESEIASAAESVGFPLLVKAVAGGGGKGMRVVRAPEDLPGAVALARSEARSAFGSDEIYLERLIERPRHVEVQLLGDEHGTMVPFVERECSIQRRHQKLVEETPSPAVSASMRARLAESAASIGRSAGYTSAGTIEFLLDPNDQFYFLEMNTRLQVEHPITEAVTGIDFVRAQIEIARGEPLRIDPVRSLAPLGHAIECRVYAEDPGQGFLPSPGVITHLRPPAGPGIRDDSGATAGWQVPTHYDALISKVIAWAPDRPGAIQRMVRALTEYELRGIRTTIDFCRGLLSSDSFAEGRFDTTTVERLLENGADPQPDSRLEELAAISAALVEHRAASLPVRRTDVRSPVASLWEQRARLEGLR
jgi:acetyl-CoA carboxylase biotin carboxylase subunit